MFTYYLGHIYIHDHLNENSQKIFIFQKTFTNMDMGDNIYFALLGGYQITLF